MSLPKDRNLRPVPVFRPHIGIDTAKAAIDALDLGWLGMGSFVQRFEAKIAECLGLTERRVVALSTGTAAIHLGLLLADVGPGDEVLTPSFNNIADLQSILATGASPVLCDVREDTLGIDCEKAAGLISEKTKVIIGMDYAGVPCDIGGVHALADEHGLRVLHDAAHSIGSKHEGRPIGSFGDMTMFSFDPIKTITCIDGGALVVNSQEEVERLHQYRLLGMTQSSSRLYSNSRAWHYDVPTVGYRYHLANLHASIGLSQLEKLDEFIANRRYYCRIYSDLLEDVDGILTPQTDFADVAPFIYVIRVLDGKRPQVVEGLADRGIETGVHWQPAHRFSLLEGCRRGDLSVTETIGDQILTLPLYSYMDTRDIERVAVAVRDALGRHATC